MKCLSQRASANVVIAYLQGIEAGWGLRQKGFICFEGLAAFQKVRESAGDTPEKAAIASGLKYVIRASWIGRGFDPEEFGLSADLLLDDQDQRALLLLNNS